MNRPSHTHRFPNYNDRNREEEADEEEAYGETRTSRGVFFSWFLGWRNKIDIIIDRTFFSRGCDVCYNCDKPPWLVSSGTCRVTHTGGGGGREGRGGRSLRVALDEKGVREWEGENVSPLPC